MQHNLDEVDRAIISVLVRDAKVPYAEIAKKLIVSPGTVHVRLKKLEAHGIIKGSELIVDPIKLGYDLTAFLGIYLEKGSQYKDVIESLKEIPEITEAHYTTGGYSIFAKIICKNTNNLRTVLNENIQSIVGIQRTETFISLEESIRRQITL